MKLAPLIVDNPGGGTRWRRDDRREFAKSNAITLMGCRLGVDKKVWGGRAVGGRVAQAGMGLWC